MNFNINESIIGLMNNIAQMVTSQFIEIAKQYRQNGALNQCFKQMLGHQMTVLNQPQTIVIDDYVKLEEGQQSAAPVKSKETNKENKKQIKKIKAKRKFKVVHNEKVNSQQEEEKSEDDKSEKFKLKKNKTKSKQPQDELQKTKVLNKPKRPLSNYNVYFRERNKSLKNLSFQEKAVMIAKEWSSMTAEEKGLYSDEPNIDLSNILNKLRNQNKGELQGEVIPTAERTEKNGENQIVNNIKSEHVETQKIVYRQEPDRQLI